MTVFGDKRCSEVQTHERSFWINQSNGRIELLTNFMVTELSSLSLGYRCQVFLDSLNVDWWHNNILLGKIIDNPYINNIFDSLFNLADSAFFERSQL